MASLFVIQGADQGKRFEFTIGPVALGRDDSNGCTAPRYGSFLDDMPRPRLEQGGYRILDLSSANGTFVNGRPVEQTALSSGDRVQLGQIRVLLFQDEGEPPRATWTKRVRHAGEEQSGRPFGDLEDYSIGRGIAGLEGVDRRRRLAGRAADELVGHVQGNSRRSRTFTKSTRSHPRSWSSCFESIGADRGAILLKD